MFLFKFVLLCFSHKNTFKKALLKNPHFSFWFFFFSEINFKYLNQTVYLYNGKSKHTKVWILWPRGRDSVVMFFYLQYVWVFYNHFLTDIWKNIYNFYCRSNQFYFWSFQPCLKHALISNNLFSTWIFHMNKKINIGVVYSYWKKTFWCSLYLASDMSYEAKIIEISTKE